MVERSGRTRVMELPEAAEVLQLPVEGVQALAGAGYLKPSEQGPAGPRFAVGDLKAFLARNAEGESPGFEFADDQVDPQALLDALDGRAEEMARRAYDIFAAAVPEAAAWSITDRARFIEQARKRFEAILAVTSQGEEVDEALVGDLQDVGATAAWSGSPLPELLVVLRISRDLVVQTAVELAEQRGRHWGLALSLLLTRVLPAMDRLTDALAQGYWAAVVGRDEESRARYEAVVEHSTDGIFAIDDGGLLQYANESLAITLGCMPDELDGVPLDNVLKPLEEIDLVREMLDDPLAGPMRFEVTAVRADGVHRVLDIRTVPRRAEGMVIGFQGVVRDVTTAHELESSKNEFLALITHDLRNPLATILGLGATLETYGPELPAARLQRMGASIRLQSERISRLAADLHDVAQLESSELMLSLRAVDVASTVEVALASVEACDDVVVDVPVGLTAHADARRLEQVVANLVENGCIHGAGPVVVAAHALEGGGVELWVRDHGEGVAPAIVPTLFSRLRTLERRDRDRSRGTGLGLSLVKGLVEAMGGRVAYERAPGGGALFRLTLQSPRPRS